MVAAPLYVVCRAFALQPPPLINQLATSSLEPQARVDAVIKLCKYLVPPMMAIASKSADEYDYQPDRYTKGLKPAFDLDLL